MIRSKIRFGVNYGSPVEKVKDIVLKVAHAHKNVLTDNKSQRPVAFFEDFGDSGLIFELNYWIVVRHPIDLKRVASELRFAINRTFIEEGITIPFSQRDLHIKEPVKVEIKQG